MALAAVDFTALAQLLSQEGMGARTLRAWADPKDDKRPQAHHLRYIAEACGVSTAFFSVDFSTLGVAASEDEVTQLRERVERLEAQDQARRLDQLADDLATLRQSVEERPGTARPR